MDKTKIQDKNTEREYAIFHRLEELIEILGINRRQMCIILGYSEGFFIKPRDIASSVIVRLHEKFPDLSYDWLLDGKGEIFVKVTNEDKEEQETKENPKVITSLLEIIDEQTSLLKNIITSGPNKAQFDDLLTVISQQNDLIKKLSSETSPVRDEYNMKK